jgi:NAD(P)-dependent dehydrogenase (short-subunit alcohol dehydrogenase family)
MSRLQGRTAIITGAGAGIGKGIARRLAREGASILVAEYNADTGAQCARELRDEFGVDAGFLQVDVGSKEQVEAMVATAARQFGSADILVNNAGGGGFMGRFEHHTDEILRKSFDVNFYAGYWAMQAAFPLMKARQWGRIINICSLNAVNAHPYTMNFNAAKEALRGLTRTAAREWARHGICANVICPAAASDAYQKFAAAYPEMAAEMLQQNPMGRMGDCEHDIGAVAAFLASDDCRYVTGMTMFVDGGSHINGVSWNPQMPE